MLVLSRKVDQSIMIGNDIEIHVTRIEGDMVKIGIQAPRSVPVHRKEVFEAIRDSNREAMSDQISPTTTSMLARFAQNKQGKSSSETQGRNNPR